jgi:hypothetical protein
MMMMMMMMMTVVGVAQSHGDPEKTGSFVSHLGLD